MIAANRAYVALRHASSGYTHPVTDATAGWYFLLYHAITPAYAYMDDPGFEQEAADLYGRAQRGEALGGTLTPTR
jgi:hypothetical protein